MGLSFLMLNPTTYNYRCETLESFTWKYIIRIKDYRYEYSKNQVSTPKSPYKKSTAREDTLMLTIMYRGGGERGAMGGQIDPHPVVFRKIYVLKSL